MSSRLLLLSEEGRKGRKCSIESQCRQFDSLYRNREHNKGLNLIRNITMELKECWNSLCFGCYCLHWDVESEKLSRISHQINICAALESKRKEKRKTQKESKRFFSVYFYSSSGDVREWCRRCRGQKCCALRCDLNKLLSILIHKRYKSQADTQKRVWKRHKRRIQSENFHQRDHHDEDCVWQSVDDTQKREICPKSRAAKSVNVMARVDH